MKRSAFTLIEVMVTIAAVVIVLPAILSIFFVILQQQTKIYRLAEVKRQGDAIVNILESAIPNSSYKIYTGYPPAIEICNIPDSSGNPSSFQDKYGKFLILTYDNVNLKLSFQIQN